MMVSAPFFKYTTTEVSARACECTLVFERQLNRLVLAASGREHDLEMAAYESV